MYCTVGLVDIGTVEKVPLNLVEYLQKVGKITQKFVWQSNCFIVGLGHTALNTVEIFLNNLDNMGIKRCRILRLLRPIKSTL
jgi:hypothetical protein